MMAGGLKPPAVFLLSHGIVQRTLCWSRMILAERLPASRFTLVARRIEGYCSEEKP